MLRAMSHKRIAWNSKSNWHKTLTHKNKQQKKLQLLKKTARNRHSHTNEAIPVLFDARDSFIQYVTCVLCLQTNQFHGFLVEFNTSVLWFAKRNHLVLLFCSCQFVKGFQCFGAQTAFTVHFGLLWFGWCCCCCNSSSFDFIIENRWPYLKRKG